MQEKVKIIQQQHKIIGREEELQRALAAVSSNKHVLFEGTVGVGKTVIAMALASHFNRKFHRVDGDERYTEHKLTGWFDPALVIAKGYSRETFILGPLTQAMRAGSFLFINELNRMPEGTQNVLLPAMDERQILIPKIGTIKAKPGFLIIATQNPEEFVGTSRLSEALEDRFVWIRLEYQSEIEEQKIVKKETGCKNEDIIAIAVKIARKTREDTDIRHGASVRGAMDITELIQRLSGSFTLDQDIWTRAAIMALATKIDLQDQTTQKLESVVKRIVTLVLSNYTKSVVRPRKQIVSKPADTAPRKEKKSSTSDLSKEVKVALGEGNLSKAIYLLDQNPQSVSEMLLEENLFETMIKVAEHSEPRWPLLHLLLMAQTSPNHKHRRIARKILSRTIVRMAAQIVGRGISPTEYVNVPYQPGLEEFNLEETLENRFGKVFLDYRDIVCVERRRKKKAFSLILDASNSMQMEKIVLATLAIGVFAYRFWNDHYSVITFKDHAQSLKSIKDSSDMEKLIDKMLNLQPGGLTNIEEALQKGLEELEKFCELERAGILITDGWVTKGRDPIKVAQEYPRLHVIQVPLAVGGGDSEMCKNLARAGRGKYSYVRDFYQLPRAIMNTLK